jgi:alpha-galactosidase
MSYWEANDKPDRIGISEIRHIEGLYAYWDSLLVRFPNILIDNCASGGRRIDLETISRSSPLWRTDYPSEPVGFQCQTYGLNFYLPLHGDGNFVLTPYDFRSDMSSAMVISWDINTREHMVTELQKYIQEFKHLRPFYYGDYYPLTETENLYLDNKWLAYQLNRPGQRDGIIMAFRRKNCPEDSIRIELRGLDKMADYELSDEDSGKKVIKKGEELNNGFTLFLSEKQRSMVVNYKQVTN